ncbi:hypothetical protein AU255_17100 [Methyloprofundus sedimenti]|uniref:Transposase IS200-like domain-containing protein n=2 Tax=Methyloprofundus sedimenti TaxID=1420851 RepID=A0A1V8M3C6_9GAMM|nr:hypothetical protein AU255_17100 [Methyloprofundus sedimenti]
MARLRQVTPVGVPQHILQRGNNRQVCFAREEDMKAYFNGLKKLFMKHQVDGHTWVMLTNYVYLLCIPGKRRLSVVWCNQSVAGLFVIIITIPTSVAARCGKVVLSLVWCKVSDTCLNCIVKWS